jgi:EAL domain-containing protein (putative c-di-GMP-specific phosphodiesterase class I)
MNTAAPPANIAGDRPAELEALAREMLAALKAVRVWSLSLHDEHADVLWLNESVLGPDEHEAVRASLEVFAGQGAPTHHEHDLGDGRVAVSFRAAHAGSVLGLVMVIVDRKAAMTETLMQPKLIEVFEKWLSDDLSATQMRLRALPELVEAEVARPAGAAAASSARDPELTLEEELTATLELLAPQTLAAAAAAPPAAPPRRPPAPAAAPVAAPTAKLPEPPAKMDPALDRHYAALRAQPIVLYVQQLEPMVEGNRIRRYEVLLRTGSEHGRSKAPTAMIEAAARHGLGSVVDRRVITDLVIWLAHNPEVWRTDPINVSVNLSPTALVDPHFFKFLDLCMTKGDLPRGMIAFELDASLCAQSPERTAEAAQLLAALGCTIILDDFLLHEGHVELLGLKGLRMLKLHRQLTTEIGADTRRQAVVAGIAQMACVLGMHTCAKAIESREDVRSLAALKVDFSQGFGFSMPAPLASLAKPAG